MRVVMWLRNEANERALAHKMGAAVSLVGIIVEHRKPPSGAWNQWVAKVFERLFIPSVAQAWHRMMKEYDLQYPGFPNVPTMTVNDINDQHTLDFTMGLNPDIVVVSGTALVRNPLIEAFATNGILNLHTGLSPYVKGGPNCTNWCLATGNYHLIGNTVMWLDAGIDSGAVVASEFTDVKGSGSLLALHQRVMEHAHDLYVRCVGSMKNQRFTGVRQDAIAAGTTFYNRDWTAWQRLRVALFFHRFRRACRSGELERKRVGIQTIDLKAVHSQ